MRPQTGTYDYYSFLPESTNNTYSLDFATITEITTTEPISIWTDESNKNDAKKTIKLILPEYYGRIQRELDQHIFDYNNSPDALNAANTIFGNSVRRIM